ncbi:MAG: putative bifunctional diguanylate cyclase/phosphodiesterase [Alphaproteobacteria bacterium]
MVQDEQNFSAQIPPGIDGHQPAPSARDDRTVGDGACLRVALFAPESGPRARVATLLAAIPRCDAIEAADAGARALSGVDAALVALHDGARDKALIAALRAAHPHLPVLAVAPADDAALMDAARGWGAQDCLALGTSDERMIGRVLRHAVERMALAREIARLTQCDPLTGLANRDVMRRRLAESVAARATREAAGALNDTGPMAVAMINLDRFRLINETLGQTRGDQLLQEVAARLGRCLGPDDSIGRHGPDEFIALIERVPDSRAAAAIAQAMIDALGQPLVIEGHEVYVTCCIGLSLFPADGDEVETLIRSADAALMRAKSQGRNHFQFHTLDTNVKTMRRLTLESDLRRALEREELTLYFQPQLDLKTHKIAAVEALLRWRHPQYGMIPPGEFIPFAEESGLIVPIGEWVLRAACEQARAWRGAGYPDLRVAVNLSSRQFFQENVLEVVTRALNASRLPPGNLELELTESAVMENPDEATVTLCLLANMGVKIAIDDFGTGYSSLNHLKRFPIDSLKIDRSFVNDITVNPDDAAIVKAVLAMAYSLRLKVIAEGVETVEQLRFLEAHDCDAVQGFLLSKPQPAEDITRIFLPPPGQAPAAISLGLAANSGLRKA